MNSNTKEYSDMMKAFEEYYDSATGKLCIRFKRGFKK